MVKENKGSNRFIWIKFLVILIMSKNGLSQPYLGSILRPLITGFGQSGYQRESHVMFFSEMALFC